MLNVSIVTFRTPDEELERCLDSLESDTVDTVTVVDNSRSPHTASLCRRYGMEYLPNANSGYGAAHNIAIRRSMETGAPYHLVLNPDVEFSPSLLDDAVAYMERHPDVGVMQPEILNSDGTPQYAARMLPTPADLIARRFLPRWMVAGRNRRYMLTHLDRTREWNIPYLQGSFMLFRTEALRQTGLFDERFFMYPEDIDLTRRIHRRWLTMFVPLGYVIHHHRAASYHSLRSLGVHVVNMIRYFNKWGWMTDGERSEFNRPLRG